MQVVIERWLRVYVFIGTQKMHVFTHVTKNTWCAWELLECKHLSDWHESNVLPHKCLTCGAWDLIECICWSYWHKKNNVLPQSCLLYTSCAWEMFEVYVYFICMHTKHVFTNVANNTCCTWELFACKHFLVDQTNVPPHKLVLYTCCVWELLEGICLFYLHTHKTCVYKCYMW